VSGKRRLIAGCFEVRLIVEVDGGSMPRVPAMRFGTEFSGMTASAFVAYGTRR
jgi:hypothetical protein